MLKAVPACVLSTFLVVAVMGSIDALLPRAQGCTFIVPLRVIDLFRDSEIALVVERTNPIRKPSSRKRHEGALVRGTSFRVLEVWKQPEGSQFEVNQTRPLREHDISLKHGVRYLLIGTRHAETREIIWESSIKGTPDYFAYLRDLPATKQGPHATMKYIARFLDSKDAEVESEAWGDFVDAISTAPRLARGIVSREWLRKQLANEDLPVTRVGALAMLLGLEGEAQDEDWLKRRIAATTGDFRPEISGVMLGYLLIAKEPGLRWLEVKTLSVSADAQFSETYAALQALRTLESEFPDRIERARLKSSMRLLLDRPEIADLAIVELTRWQDWSLHKRLEQMFDDPAFDAAVTKRAIVKYCLRGIQEGQARVKAGEDLPAHAERSTELLETLREKNPQLVNQTERYLGLMPH